MNNSINKNMSNITVIIPVHEYNETVQGFLDKAIESVIKQTKVNEIPNIIIVSPDNVYRQLNTVEKNDALRLLTGGVCNVFHWPNSGDSNFQSQINLAVERTSSEYFTVLEYDDEFSLTYFSNVENHITAYPDIDVFLPTMIEVDGDDNGIKLTNHVIWSQQYIPENGELGYLNVDALKQYSDFKLSGAVIKTAEFKNIGGYKKNIVMTFGYELLLRMLNNGFKIYTIPKIGYKHLASRVGSLSDNFKKTLSTEAIRFWFEVAATESNFNEERFIDTSKLDNVAVSEK